MAPSARARPLCRCLCCCLLCRGWALAAGSCAAADAACIAAEQEPEPLALLQVRAVARADVSVRPAAAAAAASSSGEVPAVALPSGATVTGTLLPPKGEPASSDVNAYFNIRFATAGRFEAPRAYVPRPGEAIDGTVKNKKCVQKPEGRGVEDCLTLAVYTPPGPLKQGRPVLVWIHGGNLVAGGVATYAGMLNQLVIDGDMVVVAIQYRLGLFGFFVPPGGGSVPGNRGLLDQIEGLKWVRGNIASFGGDPGSVTIMGQSAGGRSVSALYQSPLAKGLFHRAIADSPGLQDSMFVRPISEVADTMGAKCMEATGCASVECLREMGQADLSKKCHFYAHAPDFVSADGLYFTGYDGHVLTRPVTAPLCEGAPTANGDVPLLIGSMTHEWRFFRKQTPYANLTHRLLWEHMPGFRESGPGVQRCTADKILKDLYAAAPCRLEREACAAEGPAPLEAFATDYYGLGVGLLTGGGGGGSGGSGPRFRWLMDLDGAGGRCGSVHCQDIALLFGKDHLWGCGAIASPEFRNTSAWKNFGPMLREYWTSFARTGVPSSARGAAWSAVEGQGRPSWGLPLMKLNLTAPEATSMSAEGAFSTRAQEALTDILCGRTPVPTECQAQGG